MKNLENLKKTLSNPEFREKLELAFGLLRHGADFKSFLKETEGTNFQSRMYYDRLLDDCFYRILVDSGTLPGFALDDIRDAWHQSTALSSEKDFEAVVSEFGDSLIRCVCQRWRSDPIRLNLSNSRYQFEISERPSEKPLWQTTDKFVQIYLVGKLLAARRIYSKHSDGELEPTRLFVMVVSFGSASFFEKISNEATSLITKLLDCAARLALFHATDGQRILRNLRLVEATEPTDDDIETSAPTLLLLRECLDAIYTPVPGKKGKDTIQRRVKNAVRLLVEAKEQREEAIGLALSVSAIEALACRKGDNIAQMFADNMAVLLEPDPSYRAAAVKWCKGLYDLRSGVLHGSSIACEHDDVRNAECAATAVLKAMLDRRRAQRRVGGDDENPEELLRELNESRFNTGHPMFVNESPVRLLWRDPEQSRHRAFLTGRGG